MGFLFGFKPGTRKRDPLKGVSPEFMAMSGCTTCPLKRKAKARNTGPMNAKVFILGEAPGSAEAEAGRPFVGPSGRLLRESIPDGWERRVRFANVIQSFPADKNDKPREPDPVEIAHCRGYLEDDISTIKPRVILGLGNVALNAVTGQTGITRYAGRRMPVEIAGHRCWFYAAVHPAFVLRAPDEIHADAKRLFTLHVRAAFEAVDTLPEPVIDTPAIAREGIVISREVGQIVGFLERAACLQEVGFDFETNGLRPYGSGCILTVAVATPTTTLAFPLDHPEARYSTADRERIGDALIKLMEAPVVKCVHNAAFEIEWTLALLSKAAGRPSLWGCSLAQAYLLDGRPRAHSLDFLCRQYFGLNLKDMSPLEITKLANTPVNDVCEYNALDAKYHLKVYNIQREQIRLAGLQEVYDHHIARTVALVRGQRIGLPVDLKVNAALTQVYQQRLAQIAVEIVRQPAIEKFEAGGTAFNVASNKHVAAVLKLAGYDVENTEEATLAKLKGPLAKAVLAHRGTAKILGTYLTPIAGMMAEGRLHPLIACCHTRTWRTSSESPNIQNWPKRHAAIKEVRKQIVAPPGHWLVSIDYSSIQARNVAMESKDKTLVKAFEQHYDIHQDWSERIQKAAPKWAKGRDAKTLRAVAKNRFVFPSLFGAKPTTVGYYLGVDPIVGVDLQDEFWRAFPDILRWHRELRRFYRQHMYVTGLSGFRRHAPISQNELINSPIQGDEALLVCEALVRLSQYEDDALQPVMMIHDDLGFFIPKHRYDECMDTILTEMLRIEHDWINVPLAVEASAGSDWFDQVPIGQYESEGDSYVESS